MTDSPCFGPSDGDKLADANARIRNLEYGLREARQIRDLMCVILGLDPPNQSYASAADKMVKHAVRLRGSRDPGPYEDCSHCGRAMVWDRPVDEKELPVWVCPSCLLERMRRAEADLDAALAVVLERDDGHRNSHSATQQQRVRVLELLEERKAK